MKVSMPHLNRRQFSRNALVMASSLPLASLSFGQSTWSEIERKARGQTVVLNAWGGSERINAYLAWAGVELQKQFGVTLQHVKVTDTADVVKRVRNEKAAGRNTDGSVDLVWINGENFPR